MLNRAPADLCGGCPVIGHPFAILGRERSTGSSSSGSSSLWLLTAQGSAGHGRGAVAGRRGLLLLGPPFRIYAVRALSSVLSANQRWEAVQVGVVLFPRCTGAHGQVAAIKCLISFL